MRQLNGVRVARRGKTIFVVLPREAWREIEGGCSCAYCTDDPSKSGPAFWDTMAILGEKPNAGTPDTTWIVHAPELHGVDPKRSTHTRSEAIRIATAG